MDRLSTVEQAQAAVDHAAFWLYEAMRMGKENLKRAEANLEAAKGRAALKEMRKKR